VGLLTRLLTLPLEPVRGVVWLTERVAEAAEREQRLDERGVFERLARLEEAHRAGELDDDEYVAAQEELFARLDALRGGGGEEGAHG
jgi:hypothetical protein